MDHPSVLAAPQAGEPLRLERAVAAALEANRLVAVAREDVERATADLAAVRTHRLPTFSVDFLGLRTFRSVDLFFKAGALGLYPDVGPIPSADTTIPSSQAFSQLFQLRASQPITQLWEVKLRTQQLELGRELARERVDAERRAVVANVRQAYHRLLQTESAIRSSEEALTLYAEVARVVDVLVREQAVLEGDRLGVELRVAQETSNRDRLGRSRVTLKEQLNLLMGRPLDTPFEVEALPLEEPGEFDLADARARAARDRSDL
jgi:outer membrane protein TolC